MSAESVIRCIGSLGRIANRTCLPRTAALRCALSRCRMAEPSRQVVAVRSAMTTSTPGVKDAVICPAACSALAALIWAGNLTMTGDAQGSWSSIVLPLLPAVGGVTSRFGQPGPLRPLSRGGED